ncbi:MAG: hypothetical protein IIC67_02950 [Thaumarchaeota archaeon]|nr:hypothetical protein [Nitrososphaerota archaeon]
MKKLAKISSTLFSKEQTVALRLQERSYIILIPKSILEKCKIFSENLSFDLIIQNKRIALLGPLTTGPEVMQHSLEEEVTHEL